MSESIKQDEDTSSAGFKEGVEAGRNSTHKLGPESKAEGETKEPLFMRDSPDGDKGNAQDEKDETEE